MSNPNPNLDGPLSQKLLTLDPTRNLTQTTTIKALLIKSDKAKYHPGCQLLHSLDWQSAHNCEACGGKSYLWVQCGEAHCLVREWAFLLVLAFEADIDAIAN